jgi:peptide/nickel transport system substrate-binding protein
MGLRLQPLARLRNHGFGWIACATVVVAAACSRRAPEGPPENGGTLHVAVFHPLDVVAPLITLEPTTTQLFDHVVPPLGRIDDRGNIVLGLARQLLDSGREIDVTLRPVRWEDGSPVVPRDFVLAATLLADPRFRPVDRTRVELLDRAIATGDSTFQLRYLTMYGRRRSHALLAPVPSHVWHEGGDPERWRPGLACGPFRVVYSSPQRLLLARCDGSGLPPARLDTVDVRVYQPADAMDRFRRGRLDVLDDAPVDIVRSVRGRARCIALVGRSYLFLGWNLRDSRFADLDVRRALAQAVDVRRILRRWTLDQGDPARGPLVPALAFADTSAVLPFDPAAAARALDARGWRDSDRDGVRDRGGARLAFHLLTPDDDALRVGVAQDVARDLKRIGVDAMVRVLPPVQFFHRLSVHDFEAFMGQWYPDLGLDLDPVWRSDATDQFNFVGYASHAADSLLSSMWQEDLDEGRARTLAAFQARVYADQPYLFLVEKPHFVVFAPRVHAAAPNVLSPFWNLPSWWIPRHERQP